MVLWNQRLQILDFYFIPGFQRSFYSQITFEIEHFSGHLLSGGTLAHKCDSALCTRTSSRELKHSSQMSHFGKFSILKLI